MIRGEMKRKSKVDFRENGRVQVRVPVRMQVRARVRVRLGVKVNRTKSCKGRTRYFSKDHRH